MTNRKTLRALALAALTVLGVAGCDGGESTSSSPEPVDPEEASTAIFSVLDTLYTTLRTDGLLTGYSYELRDSIDEYEDITVSYSIDYELTEYQGSRLTYTLNAQSMLHLDGNTLYVDEGTIPETDSYALFTGSVTIDEQTFDHHFLVTVNQNTVVSIKYILDEALSDDQVTFRGVWMGTNGVITSGYTTYNAAYVADGEYAMQLYRLESDMIGEDWVIGETVLEVVGTYSPYNGLPEVGSITSVMEVEDDSIETPVTLNFTSETNVGELTSYDINRSVHVENVEVASIDRTNTYGNLSVYLKFADNDSFLLYMDSRYNDVDPWAAGSVDAGDIISFDTFIGWSSNAFQLIYYSNLVVNS